MLKFKTAINFLFFTMCKSLFKHPHKEDTKQEKKRIKTEKEQEEKNEINEKEQNEMINQTKKQPLKKTIMTR